MLDHDCFLEMIGCGRCKYRECINMLVLLTPDLLNVHLSETLKQSLNQSSVLLHSRLSHLEFAIYLTENELGVASNTDGVGLHDLSKS